MDTRIIPSKKAKVLFKLKPLSVLSSAFLFLHLGLLSNAYAAPQGGNVVGGNGSINQSGLQTTIQQNTQNMAIDWQSYNVQQNERVQYIQPNSRSISLNRIIGNNASTIRGQIDANGQVILVNPNGIFFSSTATINVGGIMASGLDINPGDFMNGNYIFNEVVGTDGFVINSGIINAATGGNVTLLGKQVKNDGMIVARLGTVNMAAGKAAVVTFDSAGLLGVRITKEVLQNELGLDPAVLNSGSINADGGRILLTASVSQDIFSSAVNTGDMEQATSAVVNADGTFTLGGSADVLNTGTLDVSVNQPNATAGDIVMVGENVTSSGVIKADSQNGNGGNIELHATNTTLLTENSNTSARAINSGNGGTIKVLGNKVALIERAQVDVSGVNGGGTALIGGDRTGANKQVRNAEFIYLGKDTSVNADAIEKGNGGKIITFATDTARIYGNLTARGGAQEGNGGFIETSGLIGFDIQGAPNIGAVNGQGGEWLIDPYDISIVGSTGSTAGFEDNNGPVFESNATATIAVDDIYSVLNQSGGDNTVTITTGAGSAGAGNITFNADFDYNGNGGSTLILNAANNINTNGQSIIGNNGNNDFNLELNADYSSTGTGDGVGNVIIDNSQIRTRGGSFTASGVDFTLTESLPGNNLQTNGGDVRLSMTGAVNINGAITTNGGEINVVDSASFTSNAAGVMDTSANTGGDVRITADGAVQIGADIITTGTSNDSSFTANGSSFSATAGTSINVGSATVNLDGITGAVNLANITAGSLDMSDVGVVTQTENDTIVVTGATSINSSSSVTLANASNNFGRLDLTATTATITDTNALQLGNTTVSGATFDIATGGALSQVGGTRVEAINAVTTINAASQTVILNNNNNNFSQVDITAGTATITDTNSIVLGATNISGNTLAVTARNNGDITQAANTTISATAATTALTATGNTVSVLNAGNDFNVITLNADRALIQDVNAVILGDVTTTSTDTSLYITNRGAITQQAGTRINASGVTLFDGGEITLSNATNDFEQVVAIGSSLDIQDSNALVLGTVYLTGTTGTTLNISTNGSISQTAANTLLRSNANTNINAGAGEINLGSTGNTFGGSVSLNNTGNNNIIIQDSNSLAISTSNIGSGTLTVNATGITQSGAITQQANAGQATFNAGAGVITLNNTGNDFTGAVSLNNSGANNVSLTDSNAVQLGSSNIGTGTLTVNANGIAQSGAVIQSVGAGAVTLNSGIGVIDLNNSANEFTGSVALATTSNATLSDVSNIDFSTSAIGGDLTATAGTGSDITQNGGALTVTGTSTFNVDSGRSITLLNTSNDFNGLAFNAKPGTGSTLQNVSIADINNLDLQTLNLTGNLTVTAGGNIINSAGSMVVAGDTVLNAGGNNIDLTQGSNDFNNIVVGSAANVDINDVNGINIGDAAGTQSNITGTLTINAAGDITQTAALTNNSTATFNTSNGDINLNNSANNFNNIALIASGNADVTDSTGIVIGASNVQGDLTINANGNITQIAALTNTGAATFNAGNGNISLNAANDFNVINISTSRSASVIDSNGIQLGDVAASTGLAINAGGDISEASTSRVTSNGLTTLTSTGAIQLGSSPHDFNNLVFNGTNVAINDVSGINIGSGNTTSAASASLTITANGNITDNNSGSVTVADTASLSAGSGNITLLNTDFENTLTVTAANNITVNDATGLSLGNITAASSINLTAGTDITGGNLSAANTIGLTAGTNITGGDLTAAQVNLTAATGIDAVTQTVTLNANNTAGAITIDNTGDLTIESLKTVGNITLTNDTNIRMAAGSVDADYDTGVIDMTTTTGSFLGVGAPDDNNPDITGFSGTFVGRLGTFGSVVRPLVIRLKDEILINTRQSISPRYVPQPPRIVNDLSDIKFDFIDASNAVIGEQLITLEELEDIDPAIFTDVRNYTYGQIAIRLPRDQLFEDELQELELKEGAGK